MIKLTLTEKGEVLHSKVHDAVRVVHGVRKSGFALVTAGHTSRAEIDGWGVHDRILFNRFRYKVLS